MNPVFAIALANFLSCLDTSILNVALPILRAQFGADLLAMEPVISWHSLAMSFALIPAGLMADRWGRKRVFMVGLVGFACTSAACALAPSLNAFIWARLFQGVSAALLVANANALVVSCTPAERVGGALAQVAVFVAAGLLAGPLLGAAILSFLSWRWMFWINLPVVALALFRVSRQVPESRGQAVTFSGLARAPLVIGVLGAFLNYAAMAGGFFFVPFSLQTDLALAPRWIGAVLAILPITLMMASPRAGKLSDRIGSLPLTLGGSVMFMAALVTLSWAFAHPSVASFAAGLVVLGCAVSLFQSPNNRQILTSVPPAQLGAASALTATFRNMGYACGTALAPRLALAQSSSRAALWLSVLPMASVLLLCAQARGLRESSASSHPQA